MNHKQPQSGYITVNGIKLHYLDWGGEGSPIVIAHATGFLARVYAPIARALCAIGHVFAYDQRGHGDSEPAPDDEYNWSATAADLRGFIEAMGFESVRGFGHSAGATAFGAVSGCRPGLVSRAVLVDPIVHDASDQATIRGRRDALVAGTLKRRRVFDSVEHAFRHLGSKPPFDTWDKAVLRDYCEYGTKVRADGTRELKCDPAVEAKIYATGHEFDGLGLMLNSQTPFLIIFSKEAHEFRMRAMERIRAQLKHGRILDLTKANHLLPMESPAEVAQLAVEFLGEV
jgi:pimeloyl-ACP methyl ester carboxylesterase